MKREPNKYPPVTTLNKAPIKYFEKATVKQLTIFLQVWKVDLPDPKIKSQLVTLAYNNCNKELCLV